MLKKYTKPNTTFIKISTNGILLASGINHKKKDFGSSTFCPFNGLWCIDKQHRLDEWRNTVKYLSKTRSNHVFCTRDDMFDGCPIGCASLCYMHNEKQRG